jgi:uncharacterized protein YndB with AHSA1/START domain
MTTDRIEKKVVLRAPRARVWRAIASAEEFGSWFGVKLQGKFEPGKEMTGQITMKGYEDRTMTITIVTIEPERLFSYRWHPYAIDPKLDYSSEPMTLVEMRLEDVAGETQLTIVETGFDQIPIARRAEAFRMNDGGWAQQIKNIERHVAT